MVLPPDLAANAAGVPRRCPASRCVVVAGGARRQDSVANGFDAVRDRADIVVIHDAARPFASADLISRTIDAAVESGAAIAALPASDTVKLAGAAGGTGPLVVERTMPRERVFLAQTPQAFRATCSPRPSTPAGLTAWPPTRRRWPSAAGFPVQDRRGRGDQPQDHDA